MGQRRNTYRCAVEVTQSRKYCVRIQASFGRSGWTLPVYFLASSPATALRRLRKAIDELQRSEERLRFWAVERSGDPQLLAELLAEINLEPDQRNKFPATAVRITLKPGDPLPAARLAEFKQQLAPRNAPVAA